MRITIDATGRLVVPKTLRDRLNLEGGTVLDIREREGRLELEPAATPMRLVRKGRVLVATTEEALPRIDVEYVRAVTESQRR